LCMRSIGMCVYGLDHGISGAWEDPKSAYYMGDAWAAVHKAKLPDLSAELGGAEMYGYHLHDAVYDSLWMHRLCTLKPHQIPNQRFGDEDPRARGMADALWYDAQGKLVDMPPFVEFGGPDGCANWWLRAVPNVDVLGGKYTIHMHDAVPAWMEGTVKLEYLRAYYPHPIMDVQWAGMGPEVKERWNVKNIQFQNMRRISFARLQYWTDVAYARAHGMPKVHETTWAQRFRTMCNVTGNMLPAHNFEERMEGVCAQGPVKRILGVTLDATQTIWVEAQLNHLAEWPELKNRGQAIETMLRECEAGGLGPRGSSIFAYSKDVKSPSDSPRGTGSSQDTVKPKRPDVPVYPWPAPTRLQTPEGGWPAHETLPQPPGPVPQSQAKPAPPPPRRVGPPPPPPKTVPVVKKPPPPCPRGSVMQCLPVVNEGSTVVDVTLSMKPVRPVPKPKSDPTPVNLERLVTDDEAESAERQAAREARMQQQITRQLDYELTVGEAQRDAQAPGGLAARLFPATPDAASASFSQCEDPWHDVQGLGRGPVISESVPWPARVAQGSPPASPTFSPVPSQLSETPSPGWRIPEDVGADDSASQVGNMGVVDQNLRLTQSAEVPEIVKGKWSRPVGRDGLTMPIGLEAYLRHHSTASDPWFFPPEPVGGVVSFNAIKDWVFRLRMFSRSEGGHERQTWPRDGGESEDWVAWAMAAHDLQPLVYPWAEWINTELLMADWRTDPHRDKMLRAHHQDRALRPWHRDPSQWKRPEGLQDLGPSGLQQVPKGAGPGPSAFHASFTNEGELRDMLAGGLMPTEHLQPADVPRTQVTPKVAEPDRPRVGVGHVEFVSMYQQSTGPKFEPNKKHVDSQGRPMVVGPGTTPFQRKDGRTTAQKDVEFYRKEAFPKPQLSTHTSGARYALLFPNNTHQAVSSTTLHFWNLDYNVAPIDLVNVVRMGCEVVGTQLVGFDYRRYGRDDGPRTRNPWDDWGFSPTGHAYACIPPGEPQKLLALIVYLDGLVFPVDQTRLGSRLAVSAPLCVQLSIQELIPLLPGSTEWKARQPGWGPLFVHELGLSSGAWMSPMWMLPWEWCSMASVTGIDMPWLNRTVCEATMAQWSLLRDQSSGSSPEEVTRWEVIRGEDSALNVVELAPRDAATQRPQSWRAYKFGGPLAIVRPRDPWANWAAPSQEQPGRAELYVPNVGSTRPAPGYTTRSEWAPVSNDVQTDVSNSLSLPFSHESMEGLRSGSVVSLVEGYSVGDWMSSVSRAYPSRSNSVDDASEVVMFAPVSHV